MASMVHQRHLLIRRPVFVGVVTEGCHPEWGWSSGPVTMLCRSAKPRYSVLGGAVELGRSASCYISGPG